MNTGNIFNLNDPFEKLVYNRLEEHMRGNDADYVLALMGRDFPFMSAELKTKCEKMVFEYYHTNAQGKTFAKLVWMTIGHGRDIDKPMDTQLTTSFHLREGRTCISHSRWKILCMESGKLMLIILYIWTVMRWTE